MVTENKRKYALVVVCTFGPQYIAEQPHTPGPASGSESHMDTMLFCAGNTHLSAPIGILLAWLLLIQQIISERMIYCQRDDSCRECMSGKHSPQFADCCGTCGTEDSVSFSNLRTFLAVLCDDAVWFLTSK